MQKLSREKCSFLFFEDGGERGHCFLMAEVAAVVLAAGKGKRMKSSLPKVMHRVGGKFLIRHVLDALEEAGIKDIVLVVGHGAEIVRSSLGEGYRYVLQGEQLGTAHAVWQAKDALSEECRTVVVVCGDTPLLSSATLRSLIEQHQRNQAQATVLSAVFKNPTGYGRIVRNEDGEWERIVEESDASAAEKAICEGNTGTYCFEREWLFKALPYVGKGNAQGEYYLPDVLLVLKRWGQKVQVLPLAAEEEALGINSRQQLAEIEKILRERTLERLMEEGVTIVDPASTFVDTAVEVGRDTIIYPFTFLEGKTRVGANCRLGPFARIVDSSLGEEVEVQNSVILQSTLGNRCTVGPFAYLRPDTCLADGVKVGDFVEIKKSQVGEGSKIPHLSYVGDAVIGKNVNIGAGTITCNYDGVNKFVTLIEDEAFIGSNTNLVAPVKIGASAVTGAGSTITKDVPAGALAVERSRQKIVVNWKRGKIRHAGGEQKNPAE